MYPDFNTSFIKLFHNKRAKIRLTFTVIAKLNRKNKMEKYFPGKIDFQRKIFDIKEKNQQPNNKL
jgi:hypothetical protein